MAKVSFYRGSKSKYDAELYADGLFFATDSQEILLNGKAYGYDSESHGEIASVEYTAPGTLTLTYTNGESDTVELQTASAGDSVEESLAGLISAEEIYKLSQVEDGAQVNIIETVQVNGTDLEISDKTVNIDLTDIQNDILTNKVTAADSSITVSEGSTSTGTPIAVKVASDGAINVTSEGLAVDSSALVQYVGNGKAISVSDVDSNNQKTISLNLSSATGNILNETTAGLFATLAIQTTDASSDNVLKSYKLVSLDPDGNATQLGTTIDILKDQLLQEVSLDTIPSGYTNAGDTGLKFVFVLADGTTSTQYISLAQFLEEAEAGNGIELNSGVYSVKVNTSESEKNSQGTQYIHVDADGVSVTGINYEIALAQSTVTALVEAEEIRAKAAEATLTTNLTQEISDREAGDTSTLSSAKAYTDELANGQVATNTSAIATETTRATAKETELETSISNLASSTSSALTSAVQALDYTDSVETSKVVTAVNEVDGVIATTKGTIASSDGSIVVSGLDLSAASAISSAVAAEATLRTTGDSETLAFAKEYADSIVEEAAKVSADDWSEQD